MALARLSTLAVWWIKLGILPELIEPGHPEQNPRHERLHRTLKAETTRPPAATCRAQQARFTRWRTLYNEDRPHDALAQRPPATLYHPSSRPFPSRLLTPDHPGHFEVRRVSRNGGIRWHHHRVPVSHTLPEEHMGSKRSTTACGTAILTTADSAASTNAAAGSLMIEDAYFRHHPQALHPNERA
jgi:hypothetical protein